MKILCYAENAILLEENYEAQLIYNTQKVRKYFDVERTVHTFSSLANGVSRIFRYVRCIRNEVKKQRKQTPFFHLDEDNQRLVCGMLLLCKTTVLVRLCEQNGRVLNGLKPKTTKILLGDDEKERLRGGLPRHN